MIFREYQTVDLEEICQLFYDTIVKINIKDYNDEQIKVWSNRKEFLLSQNDYFQSLYTIVAIEDDKIVGYGNIDENGYLDHLYVHYDYQGKHIATNICDLLENYQQNVKKLTVHASISARPFFEQRGYRIIKKQTVEIDGVYLNNYLMEKRVN